MFSGKKDFYFGIAERLRALRYPFFTGGVTPSVFAAQSQLPQRGAFGMAGKFLIASKTLVTGLTACALSVKAYGFASSPKGRAKSTPGSFLITPNALATSLTAWLPLWGSWRGSA